MYTIHKFYDKYRENRTLRILTPYTHIGVAESRELARAYEVIIIYTT